MVCMFACDVIHVCALALITRLDCDV